MTESVAELLSRLRFVGGPVETLYLNETRVRESFIGQMGAIESFTRTATKQGSVETPVVKINAGGSSETDVTWTLNDPITQVLVLRAALETRDLLCRLDDAVPGRYISFAGTGIISRPGVFDDMHEEALRDHPGLYEALESERSTIESISRLTEGPESYLWLLTVSEGSSVCATTLDNRWLRPAFRHWVKADHRWEIFGLFRRLQAPGVPLLATLHVRIKW